MALQSQFIPGDPDGQSNMSYNYTVYQDTEHGRQCLVRDGVEITVEIISTNQMFQIYPKIDKVGCRVLKIDEGGGPTLQMQGPAAPGVAVSSGAAGTAASRRLLEDKPHPHLTFVLPDLTESRWQYNGWVELGNLKAHEWQWKVTEEEGYGQYPLSYKMYVDDEDAPLELHMWGTNLYTGGHYDEYVADFHDWRPGPIDDEVWETPDVCRDHPDAMQAHHVDSGLRLEMARQAPNRHWGDAEYDAFVHQHGRRHFSAEDYSRRQQVFGDNKHLIEEWNSDGANSHSLGVNRFADWTHEEYLRTMLPNHGQPRPQMTPDGHSMKVHVPLVAEHMLPSTVDWRGTGAESPIKDQAACGSCWASQGIVSNTVDQLGDQCEEPQTASGFCWAFGAVGTFETALFRVSGKQRLLSEQNMMDCGWDTGNTACMGGYQNLGFDWAFKHGVLDAEEQYPYQGVSNYCRNTSDKAIHFKGNYTIVDGSEYGLKEALFTKGPMTVSVDAAPKSFVFYKSGVYNESKCRSDLPDLDHAVFASGYGTTEDGQDYWLVRNTWSTYWGEDGYIRISRRVNDCGIATQPMYVDLELQ
eukprot:jgi/Astpho2/653/Aster-x0947